MAQIAKIEVEAQMKSSSAKIYNFFKQNFTKISEICPHHYKSGELIEGEEGSTGNVKLFTYEVKGRLMSVKVKAEAFDDDDEKFIIYEAIEGEVMQMYKSLKTKITVTEEGFIKWSIQFEKANDSTPNPDLYAAFFLEVSKVLDAYLVNN